MSALKLTPKVNLRDPIYHDDNAARVHLEGLLWPQGPVCPRCGVMGDRITKLKARARAPASISAKSAASPFL